METTTMPDELVRVGVSISPKLNEQIEELIERDRLGSKSGFLHELIRLGLEEYCSGSNKILINLKMGRANDRNDG